MEAEKGIEEKNNKEIIPHYSVGDKIKMEIKTISKIKNGTIMVYVENKEWFKNLGGASFIVQKEKEASFEVLPPSPKSKVLSKLSGEIINLEPPLNLTNIKRTYKIVNII